MYVCLKYSPFIPRQWHYIITLETSLYRNTVNYNTIENKIVMRLMATSNVVVETSLHRLKPFEARKVGHVKLDYLSRSLITEDKTFLSRESCRYSVPLTTLTVISALGCTEMNLLHGLNWTFILLHVHVSQL